MIQVKGTKEGIQVLLDDELGLEEAKQLITEKFESTKDFFKTGKVNINIRSNTLSEFEIYLLQTTVKEILGEDTEVTFAQKEEEKKAETAVNFTDDGLQEGITKFYQGTVRSGQRIDAQGNLVVIGDTNPGSELVAAGNIIVMGTIKGVVHAGADGNRDAIVVALNLSPTQLRIADIITRSPDGEKARTEMIPEVAFIKDEMIYIQQYLTKKR